MCVSLPGIPCIMKQCRLAVMLGRPFKLHRCFKLKRLRRQPTHLVVRHSQLVRVNGAPHGLNVSHAQAVNDALLSFLRS